MSTIGVSLLCGKNDWNHMVRTRLADRTGEIPVFRKKKNIDLRVYFYVVWVHRLEFGISRYSFCPWPLNLLI